MPEARLEQGVPQTAGWFVLNAGDARWEHDDMRSQARFGGEGDAHFDDLGVSLNVLPQGAPMAMYHHEAGQEDFLVLRGTCVLIVEGEERDLRTWDLFHCPPGVPHTIVGASDEPAIVLAVGARVEKGSARYPYDPVALAHHAGVASEDTPREEVYAGFGETRTGAAPEGPWS